MKSSVVFRSNVLVINSEYSGTHNSKKKTIYPSKSLVFKNIIHQKNQSLETSFVSFKIVIPQNQRNHSVKNHQNHQSLPFKKNHYSSQSLIIRIIPYQKIRHAKCKGFIFLVKHCEYLASWWMGWLHSRQTLRGTPHFRILLLTYDETCPFPSLFRFGVATCSTIM